MIKMIIVESEKDLDNIPKRLLHQAGFIAIDNGEDFVVKKNRDTGILGIMKRTKFFSSYKAYMDHIYVMKMCNEIQDDN